MRRIIAALAGLLFLGAGALLYIHQSRESAHQEKTEVILEKILEGEEYLKQSGGISKERAVAIFSELAAKKGNETFKFRISYNLAQALEKNADALPALDIYRELKKMETLSTLEKNQLSYGLGNLLLKLGNEVEAKSHLESVLQNSTDQKLRAKTLLSLADHSFRKSEFEAAKKNYVLALQEDPNLIDARIGWGKSLRKLGKDWASFDVFDDYLETHAQLVPDNGKTEQEYKDAVFEDAKSAYLQKQYTKSIELFRKVLSVKPNEKKEEESLYYLASAYDAIGKKTEAISTINTLLNNGNYSLDQAALYKKGTIYFRLGKYDQAASVFQTIVDKYPKNQITEKALAWKKESLDQIQDHQDLEGSDSETKDSMRASKTNPTSKVSGEDLDF